MSITGASSSFSGRALTLTLRSIAPRSLGRLESKFVRYRLEMPETRVLSSATHPHRMKLEPYSAEIHLAHLTVGLDNIHYDVFLSPRFVEFSRRYLLDMIRQTVNISLFYGKDRKKSGTPENAAFRRMLAEILQIGRA